MSPEIEIWRSQLKQFLHDFVEQANLKKNAVVVVGCSTSEVLGERIGTAGSEQVAELIFEELGHVSEQTGCQFAFQCCEHINRALVIERDTQERLQLEEVTVVPVRTAGGAMATYAYHHFKDPVVVEHLKADAGIDIGDTFIGMHLKHVVVPIRSKEKTLGHAHVTMAKTRPKLIGGARAVYTNERSNLSC